MGWNIILILVFLFVFTTERHQKTLLFDAVRYWIISYQHTANLTSSWGLPPWSTIHTLRQERRARAKCWKNNHRCRNSHSTRPAPPRPETHLCWRQLQPSGRKKSQKPGSFPTLGSSSTLGTTRKLVLPIIVQSNGWPLFPCKFCLIKWDRTVLCCLHSSKWKCSPNNCSEVKYFFLQMGNISKPCCLSFHKVWPTCFPFTRLIRPMQCVWWAYCR